MPAVPAPPTAAARYLPVRRISMLQLHQQTLCAIQVIRHHHQNDALRRLRNTRDIGFLRRNPLPIAASEEYCRQQHRAAKQQCRRSPIAPNRASPILFSDTESVAAQALPHTLAIVRASLWDRYRAESHRDSA